MKSKNPPKLSETAIAEIKESTLSQRELARKYGVAQSTISRIKKIERSILAGGEDAESRDFSGQTS